MQKIYKNQSLLRYGYTTGSCAAAAAQAATSLLLTGQVQNTISLQTPKGILLQLEIEQCYMQENYAYCSIRKDSGDDPDITNGILIGAKVQKCAQGISILAGNGIGMVTKPGLSVPVGHAAINPAPKAQIFNAVRQVFQSLQYKNGVQITIEVPNGQEIAKRTFNPQLGIINGISILGTTGIVEPMSESALIDTIHLELDSLYACGAKEVLICPGNYGFDFAKKYLGLDLEKAVKCSNFIGDTIDYAVWKGFERIFLVGHAGKLIKLAAGIMNTHSSIADGRKEIITAYAGLAGASHKTLCALMESATVDGCIELLQQEQLTHTVFQSIGKAIDNQLRYRVASEKVEIAYLMFTNCHGVLAHSQTVQQFCKKDIEK